MSMSKRRNHSTSFKAKLAFEALKELETLAALSSRHGVHSNQIRKWKQQLKEGAVGIFEGSTKSDRTQEQLVSELYEQIGQLQMELTWLKKRV